MNRQNHSWLLLFFLWLLLFSGHAQAAGLFVPGRGVHPIGRAGASFAGGDTLQTLWYNPANLVEMSGFSVLIDVGLIQNTTSFLRAERPGEEGNPLTYDPVVSEPNLLPDPTFVMAYGWKKQRVTVAFGFYAPYGSIVKFPDTGPQRYSVVDITGSLFAIAHLAAAWAPHPRFRIGAGIQNHMAEIRLVRAASAYLGVFGGPEDPDLDLFTEAKITGMFNLSGNVGVWGRVLDLAKIKLDLAVSVQLPVQIRGAGEIKVRLPTNALFDSTSVQGKKINTGLSFPLTLRGAARLTLFNRADLEVAFVYEGWSVLRELKLEPLEPLVVRNVPTIGDYKVPPIRIPRNLQDAYSIRIGGSVNILPKWLQLRLGYTYETGATPDSYNGVFFYDNNKHLFGVGLTVTFKRQAIDFSYAHILFPTHTITTSQDKQLNPLNEKGAIVIGNGTYNSSFNIVGVAWRGSFF